MAIAFCIIMGIYAALIFYKGPDIIDLCIDTAALIASKVERKTKRALRRWREILGR